MSVDGENKSRRAGCINVHSTGCTVEYSITEIRFGMYAAAVFFYDYLVPDKISDLSNFSNVVQLNHQSYPSMHIVQCVCIYIYIYIYIYLMQKHLRCKKVRPSKVESYLEVNA